MMKKKLNILVEIGHPAHVHFFKNPVSLWKKEGHNILIVTRDKEITHQLLREIGLPYIPLSRQQTGLLFMLAELLYRWIKLFFLMRKQKTDISISISGITTALPSRLSRILTITDNDTEDADMTNNIAFRYSDAVLTPSTFLKKEKFPNITTYPSFHELAYLHPRWFKPDKKNLRFFNIRPGEKYIFLRLVKWKALHDIDQHGISEENLKRIIRFLNQKKYNVYLSSERPLSPEFSPYLVQTHLSRIFDLLAFSSGYIGESPTMAVESLLLGKPSLLINSRVNHLGNMIELQEKYRLLYNFTDFNSAFPFLTEKFLSPQLSRLISRQLKKLLKDKIDISTWLARFVTDFYYQHHGSR